MEKYLRCEIEMEERILPNLGPLLVFKISKAERLYRSLHTRPLSHFTSSHGNWLHTLPLILAADCNAIFHDMHLQRSVVQAAMNAFKVDIKVIFLI